MLVVGGVEVNVSQTYISNWLKNSKKHKNPGDVSAKGKF